MGKNKEYELAIKIAGEVEKSFYESMHLSKQELQAIAKQAAETTMRMEKITGHSAETSAKIRESLSRGIKESEPFFSGLESAAKKAFDGISKAAMLTGAGLTAGLVASVHVGSEFESAFAGVKKTVTASDAELEQMRDSIRGLSKEMPATAAELSAIAESAGQLGIHNENIIEFTETMANLDVATNLGEDAAAEFAKFANITGMEQEYFDNLGSSVVALGNNMATTEADIMSMGMRISAAGDQIRLSEAQIMAYSAALSSVGIEAEAGGTSFSKLLTNLQLAAETGKKLDEYARIAGMTGNEFKQAFQEDATVAINSFISGLNDTEQNGKSAIAVLDEMEITETRFRDTLLRSGNASELFADALNISNTAWEENTALANEAEQRYKTFESQCQMTQNKLADIGITVYDDLRPALTDGIGLVNEFIDGFADQNMIGEYIESATKEMPTMARKAKEAGEALSEFADPLLQVGGWLVDNPGVITGTIAGVGMALGGYKVASGISSLAKAFGALSNPVGIGAVVLGGAAAAITGISTSVKKAAAEAKQANLDAHFGDISLSISELEETAAAMIQNQNLDKLRESMEAMGVVDDIADDIRDAERELNKLDWKVSVGMELTEDEQEEYQRQVESFVASTQEFLTQDQYALSLSVKVLFGDDTENANAVLDQIDDHYEQLQQKMEEERLKLEDLVSKAREDGMMTPEETEEIENQREIISQIQNDLVGNEYESKLDVIETRYRGKNIDAESVINLFSETGEQINEQITMYEGMYAELMDRYRGMYEGEELKAESDRAQRALLRQEVDTYITPIRRELDIVKDAYGEEWDEVTKEANIATEEQLKTTLLDVAYWGTPTDALDAVGKFAIDYVDVDQSTRDAYADLYSPMETALQELQELEQQLISMGEEVPDEMKELMEELASVGVVAGNEDAAWELLGNLAESEEYQDYLKTIDEAGGYIPEELAAAIADNQQLINDAVDASYITTEEMVNQTYGNGFDVTAPLNVTIPTTLSSMKDVAISAEAHKDGGIFTQPHLGLVAEAGYPESIIPINNSPEAIDLWLKTGELLGMDGLTGGAEPLADDIAEAAYGSAGEMVVHIEHNPTLQFYGGTPSKEDIEDVLESDAEEFDRKMQDWLASGRRLKFTDVFG